jgi:hypothetical protein
MFTLKVDEEELGEVQRSHLYIPSAPYLLLMIRVNYTCHHGDVFSLILWNGKPEMPRL